MAADGIGRDRLVRLALVGKIKVLSRTLIALDIRQRQPGVDILNESDAGRMTPKATPDSHELSEGPLSFVLVFGLGVMLALNFDELLDGQTVSATCRLLVLTANDRPARPLRLGKDVGAGGLFSPTTMSLPAHIVSPPAAVGRAQEGGNVIAVDVHGEGKAGFPFFATWSSNLF